MLIDIEEEKAVWAMAGLWKYQHDPSVLDNGNILLFDNFGDEVPFGDSRVIEIDPADSAIVWRYRGTKERPLFTELRGATERLPNGNTLIVESFAGRAIEVTNDGEVVWEFLTPYRQPFAKDRVATILDIRRLEKNRSLDWIAAENENL